MNTTHSTTRIGIVGAALLCALVAGGGCSKKQDDSDASGRTARSEPVTVVSTTAATAVTTAAPVTKQGDLNPETLAATMAEASAAKDFCTFAKIKMPYDLSNLPASAAALQVFMDGYRKARAEWLPPEVREPVDQMLAVAPEAIAALKVNDMGTVMRVMNGSAWSASLAQYTNYTIAACQ